ALELLVASIEIDVAEFKSVHDVNGIDPWFSKDFLRFVGIIKRFGTDIIENPRVGEVVALGVFSAPNHGNDKESHGKSDHVVAQPVFELHLKIFAKVIPAALKHN